MPLTSTVRDYYFDPADRKLIYKNVQKWFLQEFWDVPSQSTILGLLSKTFEPLGAGVCKPSKQKQSHVNWTDWEDILFKWQQIMKQMKVKVIGDILKEIATLFWEKNCLSMKVNRSSNFQLGAQMALKLGIILRNTNSIESPDQLTWLSSKKSCRKPGRLLTCIRLKIYTILTSLNYSGKWH